MSLLTDVIGYGTHAARPAAGSAGRLYYETDTDTLLRDNATTWDALTLGGGGALTMVSNQLSADVTMTVANLYYDGPSVILTAGTWLLTASVNAYNSMAGSAFDARLWDGTTTAASAEGVGPTAWQGVQLPLTAVVTVTAPTTYKVSVASSAAGSVLPAAQLNNSSGPTVSTLVGLKVA